MIFSVILKTLHLFESLQEYDTLLFNHVRASLARIICLFSNCHRRLNTVYIKHLQTWQWHGMAWHWHRL